MHKVEFENVTLWRADCYHLLDAIPQDSALVTDPPYGIGYDYEGGDADRKRIRQSDATLQRRALSHGRMIKDDDKPFDPAPFLGFKHVFLWGADKYRERLPASGSLLAWNKNDGTGPNDNFTDCEFAWTNREKVKRNCFTFLWKGLCCVKTGEDNGVRWHPNLKPQGVCNWALKTMELPPDTLVVDPFMGSGSLGIACYKLGLRYIGVEIDPVHFATACKRIELEMSQRQLAL